MDPDVRLAALVHRTRCTPQRIGRDLVPQAIELLRQSRPTPPPHTSDDNADDANAVEETDTSASLLPESRNVPPEIAAAFEDLERHNRVLAPTTSLLRTFHAVLDARIPERTVLLTEELGSFDAAVRYDAIRTAQDLIATWRGDHTELVLLLADCLLPDDPYTAATAAGLRCVGFVHERPATNRFSTTARWGRCPVETGQRRSCQLGQSQDTAAGQRIVGAGHPRSTAGRYSPSEPKVNIAALSGHLRNAASS